MWLLLLYMQNRSECRGMVSVNTKQDVQRRLRRFLYFTHNKWLSAYSIQKVTGSNMVYITFNAQICQTKNQELDLYYFSCRYLCSYNWHWTSLLTIFIAWIMVKFILAFYFIFLLPSLLLQTCSNEEYQQVNGCLFAICLRWIAKDIK